ncbi:MAG: MipA/OmpV family protein [Rubrivivax sp.]
MSSPASTPRTTALRTLAVTLCSAVTHAAAQQPPGAGAPDTSTWGLGLGAISVQKPYAGKDRETWLLPMLHFENRYVRVFGPSVEAKLPSLGLGDAQRLDFRIVGQYDGSGYEADDAPVLAGMAKRKAGFWAGAKAKWHNGVVDVGAEWLADVSGRSKGQRFGLGLEKTWHLGTQLLLTPRLGAHWLDSKFIDYYYGVRSSEALAGRPAYAGRAGVNLELGLRAMLRLDGQQALMFDAGVTSLASEIRDSPLVGRSSDNRVLLGYMYRF